jgi:hypothetical protein
MLKLCLEDILFVFESSALSDFEKDSLCSSNYTASSFFINPSRPRIKYFEYGNNEGKNNEL